MATYKQRGLMLSDNQVELLDAIGGLVSASRSEAARMVIDFYIGHPEGLERLSDATKVKSGDEARQKLIMALSKQGTEH